MICRSFRKKIRKDSGYIWEFKNSEKTVSYWSLCTKRRLPMGIADAVTKKYLQDNEVFSDVMRFTV